MWNVHVNVLLNNCEQNITPLSLLVGTTVVAVLMYNPREDKIYDKTCYRSAYFIIVFVVVIAYLSPKAKFYNYLLTLLLL